jgi:hypothetical protein
LTQPPRWTADGDAIFIGVTVTSGDLSVYSRGVRVLGVDGSELCASSLVSKDLNCTLEAAGTDTILVGDDDGQDVGTYTVQVQRTGG